MASSRKFNTTFEDLAPDVRLRIVQSGQDQSPSPGPTLLFLHFAGGSADTWSPVANLLPPSVPTVALDFRGWGESTGPNRSDAYHIRNLADDVAAVIDRLQLRRVVFVGHSMGGKVAMALAGQEQARSEGSRVVGVMLIGPASPLPMALPPEMAEQQVQAYVDPQVAEFVARNVLTWHPPSPPSESEAKPDEGEVVNYASIVASLLRNNRWASEAWPTVAMKDDVLELARQISVPVVVVAGEKDMVEPVEKMEREVVPNIPGARLVVLEESGHLMPVEKPERLAKIIMELIEGLVD